MEHFAMVGFVVVGHLPDVLFLGGQGDTGEVHRYIDFHPVVCEDEMALLVVGDFDSILDHVHMCHP